MKSTQKDKKLRRIRNRASYLLFKQLYDFLKDNPGVVDILREIHDILDMKRSYGSERNAGFAAESLEWMLRDNGEINTIGEESQTKPEVV